MKNKKSMVPLFILNKENKVQEVNNKNEALALSQVCYYILTYESIISFDGISKHNFYEKENNLEDILNSIDSLIINVFEYQKEWLSDEDTDKCGYETWLLSDDPHKNDPENSFKTKEFLSRYTLRPASERIKKLYMHRTQTLYIYPRHPIFIDENGMAELDICYLKRKYLTKKHAVEIMSLYREKNVNKAMDLILFIEEVSTDLELALKLNISKNIVSEARNDGNFIHFCQKFYPDLEPIYINKLLNQDLI